MVGSDEIAQDVYAELRALAERQFRHQPAGHTLQPTALVHEAYVKMAGRAHGFESRDHFLAVAARAMRQILVDRARRVRALRHGGGALRITVDEGLVADDRPADVDLVALDDALSRLRDLDERKARVVELRFFGGLDITQAADALGVARSTVADDWRMARAWLARELGEAPEAGDDRGAGAVRSGEPKTSARNLFARASELFRAALRHDGDDRVAFLDTACAGDDALRREVNALLAADAAAPTYLDDAALAAGAQRRAEAALSDAPPTTIGDYTVNGVLGRGGMGVVYRAEQASPRRDVAVKVMRADAFDTVMLRRFELEAHVLGRLDHPGIARIYEAGVDERDGMRRPYLAMELVHGHPLTDHVAAARLDIRARLDLLARVCDAVQHAHQKGIIHRDLKPGNVLVDDAGQPHIVDFGVARTVGADTLAATLTQQGQLVGTLAYMSPEQVAGDGDDIDTRSDVYALGVILFEVLAGRLPHDLTARSVYEAVRIVREERIPRLGPIDRRLAGDVETIVARATDPDRERRYRSAGALASDLRDHLAARPIAARRDSTTYVLGRYARRHLGAIVTTAVIIGLAIVAVGVTVHGHYERRVARDVTALLAIGAEIEDPFDPKMPPVEQLERAASWVSTLDGEPEQAADLHSVIGLGFLKHGRYDEAEPHLAATLALRSAHLRAPHIDLASALHNDGRARYFLGRYDEAERRFRDAIATARAVSRSRLDERKRLLLDVGLAESVNSLGVCLRHQGRLDEAEPLLREALDMRRNLGLERWVAASMNNLALCLRDQGKWSEAERGFRAALDMIESFDDVNPRYAARGRRSIARCLVELERYDEALAMAETAHSIVTAGVGRLHPDVIACRALTARIEFRRGALDRAEDAARGVIADYEEAAAPPTARMAEAYTLLGEILAAAGRHEDASEPLRRALDLLGRTHGEDDDETQRVRRMLRDDGAAGGGRTP